MEFLLFFFLPENDLIFLIVWTGKLCSFFVLSISLYLIDHTYINDFIQVQLSSNRLRNQHEGKIYLPLFLFYLNNWERMRRTLLYEHNNYSIKRIWSKY